MEKVKVTQGQADALEVKLKESTRGGIVRFSANPFSRMGSYVNEHNKAILDMELDNVIKALYIGYEVEEVFEIGDWIYNKKSKRVARIDDRYNNEDTLWVDDNVFNFYSIEESRHATPEEIAKEKQRRWWKSHGRDVWELRKGDGLININTGREYEVKGQDASVISKVKINDNETNFSLNSNLDVFFRVKYFVEDRKDIKQGEAK